MLNAMLNNRGRNGPESYRSWYSDISLAVTLTSNTIKLCICNCAIFWNYICGNKRMLYIRRINICRFLVEKASHVTLSSVNKLCRLESMWLWQWVTRESYHGNFEDYRRICCHRRMLCHNLPEIFASHGHDGSRDAGQFGETWFQLVF